MRLAPDFLGRPLYAVLLELSRAGFRSMVDVNWDLSPERREGPTAIVAQEPRAGGPIDRLHPLHLTVGFDDLDPRSWRTALHELEGEAHSLADEALRHLVAGRGLRELVSGQGANGEFARTLLEEFGFGSLARELSPEECHAIHGLLPVLRWVTSSVETVALAFATFLRTAVRARRVPAAVELDPGSRSILGGDRHPSLLGRWVLGDSLVLDEGTLLCTAGPLESAEADRLVETGWLSGPPHVPGPKLKALHDVLIPYWLELTWEFRINGERETGGPWVLGRSGSSLLGDSTLLTPVSLSEAPPWESPQPPSDR